MAKKQIEVNDAMINEAIAQTYEKMLQEGKLQLVIAVLPQVLRFLAKAQEMLTDASNADNNTELWEAIEKIADAVEILQGIMDVSGGSNI